MTEGKTLVIEGKTFFLEGPKIYSTKFEPWGRTLKKVIILVKISFERLKLPTDHKGFGPKKFQNMRRKPISETYF